MKKVLMVLAGVVLAVSWGASAVSDFQTSRCDPESSGLGDPEFSSYLSAWEDFYPTSTIPARMTAQTGSRCNTCHHPPNRGTQGTCYKDDLVDLLNGGATIEEAIAALDAVDSDGDGVPNGVEITTQRTDDPNEVGYHQGLVGDMGTDPCGEDPNEVVSGVLETPPAASETICPDDPNDFMKTFGGIVTGDASDLCVDDDVRLEVLQTARLSPLLPFIRLDYWGHTSLDGTISSLEYHVEAHVSALVGGGQNPDTMRTSIRKYTGGGGQYQLVDSRATSFNSDEMVIHLQDTNATDYVQAGDGEIKVRSEAFNPGNAFSPNWSLKVDLYEVTVQ